MPTRKPQATQYLTPPDYILPFIESLGIKQMGFTFQFEWCGAFVFKRYLAREVYELKLSVNKTSRRLQHLEVTIELMSSTNPKNQMNEGATEVVQNRKELVMLLADWELPSAICLAREYKIDSLLA